MKRFPPPDPTGQAAVGRADRTARRVTATADQLRHRILRAVHIGVASGQLAAEAAR